MIREATQNDIALLAAFRTKLWPACVGDGNLAEIREMLASPSHAFLLAFDASATPCGYVELSLRDYVDGCDSRPVAYVEGIYVDAPHRRQGHGRALINHAKAWARAQGCTELGSDALISDHDSIRFHNRTGFQEVERHVVFLQRIQQ